MRRQHNWGPLFLVEAAAAYEPARLIHTCVTVDDALSEAGTYMESEEGVDGYDERVWVRVVTPGPGPGVVVARWWSERTFPSWPTVMGPDGWQVEDDGPPTEGSVLWERVL